MIITRWDPFRELAGLQNRVNTLFQDFSRGQGEEALVAGGNFIPAADIYEDEHQIVIKLEVPGIDQKDVDIRIENNTLTVRGERKFEKEEKEENFHRIERRYGSFTRSFALPNTVDSENITADYSDGVLRITLAKKAEAKPKQIKVNVGSRPKAVEGKVESKTPGQAA